MDNRRDERGDPICHVCERSIVPGTSVVFVMSLAVHVDCFEDLRRVSGNGHRDPRGPSP